MLENVVKILKITKKNFAHFFNKGGGGGGSTTLIIRWSLQAICVLLITFLNLFMPKKFLQFGILFFVDINVGKTLKNM